MRCDCGCEFEPVIEYQHRLICGDCTDAAVVARVMGGEKAQACMTDPPWNIDWKYIGNTDDKLTPNQYKAMIDAWLSLAELHSLPGSFFFVWQAMKWCKYYSFFFDRDYRIMAICQNWVQFLPTAVQYAFDPVLFWVHEGKTLIEPQAGRRDYFISSTAGGRNTDDLTRLHTASRPLDAVEYVIDNFSISGAIVYEPFCGSGSVIIACERLNRRCRAVEISPAYVAVALERWAVMTGQEPVLLDDGRKQE